MEKEKTYQCEKCNFNCNTKARWEAHINTELHKTGKRKERSDKKIHICECGYKTNQSSLYKDHKLRKHSEAKDRENNYTYYCNECDFGCNNERMYKNHELTKKHRQMIKNEYCDKLV